MSVNKPPLAEIDQYLTACKKGFMKDLAKINTEITVYEKDAHSCENVGVRCNRKWS